MIYLCYIKNENKIVFMINKEKNSDIQVVFDTFFFNYERKENFNDKGPLLKDSLNSQNNIKVLQYCVTSFMMRSSGHDTILGQSVRHCTNQLRVVFTNVLLMCLNTNYVENITDHHTYLQCF